MILILLALRLLFMPPVPQDDWKTALEHARTVNLERAAALPNFVADEKAVRYKSRHTNPPKWEYVDTIESEISVKGGSFRRDHVVLNRKPFNKPSFPNFNWGVQFGQQLLPLFEPKCQPAIEFEGRQELNGKPVLAYRFRSEPNGCFGTFTITSGFIVTSTKSYNPAHTGRFLIEDPGGSVIQFESEAHEFPKEFGADPVHETQTWAYVKIGDASHLLPVATEIYGGFTHADLWHVVVEYTNHRHFEANTTFTFK
jgi:hypothetical protein